MFIKAVFVTADGLEAVAKVHVGKEDGIGYPSVIRRVMNTKLTIPPPEDIKIRMYVYRTMRSDGLPVYEELLDG